MTRRARIPLSFAVLGIGLSVQAAALAYVALVPESAGQGSIEHPAHAGLRIAPDAFQRSEPLRLATQFYGAGVLATLLALLALGLGGGSRLRPVRAVFSFALASAAFAGSYAAVWTSYQGAGGSALHGVLGLPSASAWFLFALWPAEALFALVFVLHFRTAYWTPQAEARFGELLAARRTGEGGASSERGA